MTRAILAIAHSIMVSGLPMLSASVACLCSPQCTVLGTRS